MAPGGFGFATSQFVFVGYSGEPFSNRAFNLRMRAGVIVEQLLESGVAVYPVSPTSAKAYRQRKVPSGNKTEHVDAWSLADALRVDGHGWKALAKEDPLVAELRLLCRDEVAPPPRSRRW